METGQPRDPGLQPERTRLSAIRTGLALAVSLAVALLLMARLNVDVLGALAWAVAAAGVLAVAAAMLAPGAPGLRVGQRAAAYSAAVVLIAVIELLSLLLR